MYHLNFFVDTFLFLIILTSSFGQETDDNETNDNSNFSPNNSNLTDTKESPLTLPFDISVSHPLSNNVIVLIIFLIILVVMLVGCIYIVKYKSYLFTRFTPVPTQPKNVDQHNLPIVEKPLRVLESNRNNTNTSFENSFLDDTSKNSFNSTRLHARTSMDHHSNEEAASLVVNHPSTTSLPPSDYTK
ncbi:4214_t:CDS:1 [Funneliformis geosporum]|uniref:7386_t:CDS:1 n=1 Tax=Funneliformis geosporum TaxID=1117311 RepID=A0A9W4SHW2_9GLOM|nr:7386_t:CDS:1 [Funneliformis geosporum]CAI2174879.1 4214_t:CDS:1 [Funneliformis geosporum]